ncbi:hypothetical protein [Diaminobutyricimonas sp. TR449]|uniref:hypothetical protein n=1 Tax=Diaminobutyricimonas sp. TR449 TaxID=2708076 RepID=UPI00141E196C|nr:hypothetical protein [Diaminobutyricimonas sp. TR449]
MHTRLSVALRATAVVAVALLLAGCGSPGSRGPDAEPAAAVDCAQTAADAPAAGRVPSDFEPVAVYRCDQFGTMEDAEGRWSAITAERLEGDLEPLLAALDEPDDARWLGPCAVIMVLAPELWLVDLDGVAIRVALPSDGCGQPKVDPVNIALGALTVVERSSHPLELIDTRAAIEAGCPTRWAPLRIAAVDDLDGESLVREDDLVERGLSEPKPVPSGEPGHSGVEVRDVPMPLLVSPDHIDGMLLCRYASEHLFPTPEAAGTSVHIGGPESGRFVDGRTLSLEDALTVLAAAANIDVMPPIDCTLQATEVVTLFPLLNSAITGSPITVEVDGCQRLTVFGPGAMPVPAEVLAIVS